MENGRKINMVNVFNGQSAQVPKIYLYLYFNIFVKRM